MTPAGTWAAREREGATPPNLDVTGSLDPAADGVVGGIGDGRLVTAQHPPHGTVPHRPPGRHRPTNTRGAPTDRRISRLLGQRTPSPPRPAATGHVVLDEDPLTRGAKSSVLPVDKLCAWAYTECHREGLVDWARSDGREETVSRAREGSRCDGLERCRALRVDVGRRRALSDLICPGDYHMSQGVCHRKGRRGR